MKCSSDIRVIETQKDFISIENAFHITVKNTGVGTIGVRTSNSNSFYDIEENQEKPIFQSSNKEYFTGDISVKYESTGGKVQFLINSL